MFVGGAMAVVAIGLIAYLLVRDTGPDPGPVVQSGVTAPGETLVRLDTLQCHREIPGWRAAGSSDDIAAVRAWYAENFGALVQPWTDLANSRGAIGEMVVYEDIAVWFREEGRYTVSTFESADHSCVPDGAELWDGRPVTAWSGIGVCDELDLVGFGGATGIYGPKEVAPGVVTPPLDAPPRGWESESYDSAATIWYNQRDASEIVIRFTAGAELYRYAIGGCAGE